MRIKSLSRYPLLGIGMGSILANLFFVAIFATPGLKADQPQEAMKAVIEKVEETSKPIFDPESFKNEPKDADSFLQKIRKDRQKFFLKEQEKKGKMLEKIRRHPEDSEKNQKRLADYHKKETERLQKFFEKQQKKIDKHNQDQN